YSATTSTASVTSTSGCSFTGTSAGPSSLSGSASCALRRSGSTPAWGRTASAAAAAVTDPNNPPPSPARARSPRCPPVSLRGQRLGLLTISRVARGSIATHRLGLLHDALGRLHRETTRHEVVAGEAVGDLDEITLAADVLDVVAQDNLHGCSSTVPGASGTASAVTSGAASAPFPLSGGAPAPSPASAAASRSGAGSGMRSRSRRPPRLRWVTWRTLYGSTAISRAMRIARATARCCWALLPVTRRARILARSDMNRRSRLTSL